ncbi:spermidine synthase [Acididesulfobacillus acetoxydans]|uniref:Polyamine aminopropyltransferase n=1 Tax=Acididesulfobacillus acetoxydans TaxID=1561005 RepID=A0A8S0W6K7_9FIRM|nr:polyamine aminopropyltransferase [Acididesulfobacillus acetoxydans]CAA7599939.1 spermidine synthase [Acididesulfobacillus acetoxydans]CEJ07969.1 Spermidine synthase [Acididesulfobacillus acetoxydans]
MELWYTEKQTPHVGITCKISRTLHTEQTPYQHLAMIDTEQFGRMLVLDGMVMTTVQDEFVYHEMISHVALNTHPNPEQVLVIGGGDGGAIREVVKHASVKKATLVEIDARVIETSKEYLPEISSALSGNPRVEVVVDDGIAHVKKTRGVYDVILVDSTEPIGPAEGLFALDFYRDIFAALKDDGIMVAQTESPFFNADLIRRVYKDMRRVFPITKLYLAAVPTYPSGLWSFTMGSKRWDPEQVEEEKIPALGTKYYSADIHKAVFKLPRFVRDLLE